MNGLQKLGIKVISERKYEVQSSSHPETWHHVWMGESNQSCSCPATVECKHIKRCAVVSVALHGTSIEVLNLLYSLETGSAYAKVAIEAMKERLRRKHDAMEQQGRALVDQGREKVAA